MYFLVRRDDYSSKNCHIKIYIHGETPSTPAIPHILCVCVCVLEDPLSLRFFFRGGGIFLRKSGVKMPEIRINVTTKEENRDNGRGHQQAKKKKGEIRGKKKGPLWILKRGRKSRDGWGGGGRASIYASVHHRLPISTDEGNGRWSLFFLFPSSFFFFPFYSAAATPQNPTSKGPCTISSGIHIHIRLMMASFFFSLLPRVVNSDPVSI